MMHTYIQLSDGTHIGYGEPLADGTVKVAAVRFGEDGFAIALCTLPDYRWIEAEGFSAEEFEALEQLLKSNVSLILRMAREAASQVRLAEVVKGATGVYGSQEVTDASCEPNGGDAVRDATGSAPAVPHEAADVQGPPKPAPGVSGASGAVGHSQGAPGNPSQDYRQAAAAVLDAASLVGRVMPATKVGRLVNTAMPAARTVAAAAPGIVEKAAPVVTQAAGAAAEAAPKVAEKAARGIGRLGSKIAKAAAGAVDGVVDGAKQAAENYHRENKK